MRLLLLLLVLSVLITPSKGEAGDYSEAGWNMSGTLLELGMSAHGNGNMGVVWRPGFSLGYMNHVLRPDMRDPLQRLKDLNKDLQELKKAAETGNALGMTSEKRAWDEMMRRRNEDQGWPINWGFAFYADFIIDSADLEVPDKAGFPSMYGGVFGLQGMWKWFSVYGGLAYMERHQKDAETCSPSSTGGYTMCTDERVTVSGSGWEAGMTIAFKSFWTASRTEIPVGYGLAMIIRPRIADVLHLFAVRLSGGQVTFDNTTDTFGMISLLMRTHWLWESDPPRP